MPEPRGPDRRRQDDGGGGVKRRVDRPKAHFFHAALEAMLTKYPPPSPQYLADRDLVGWLMGRCADLSGEEWPDLMSAVDVVKPGLVGGQPLDPAQRGRLRALRARLESGACQ